MRKLLLLLCCILVINILCFDKAAADEIDEEEMPAISFYGEDEPVTAKELSRVNAGAAIVMDFESGRVLYEKNAKAVKSMASTTKIMTAILAIENGDLNDIVTVSKRAASIWGSTIDLIEGEKLTLRDMLYGMMISSGNDAAIAVAEHIGGTVENFCMMMTSKAAELGAVNTSFKSPHGLDSDGHYTTAYDMALITRYALANPVFSAIVGTKSITIGRRSLQNTNEMLSIYPGADGVKTGYTGLAGRCLVTSATRNGMRLISVILNCTSRASRAENTRIVLDYSFENYKVQTLLKANEHIDIIPLIRGIRDEVEVEAIEGIKLPMSIDEISGVQKEVILPQSLKAPVSKGIEVGKIVFTYNGNVLGESVIKTSTSVRRKNFFDYIENIFTEWGRIMRPASVKI